MTDSKFVKQTAYQKLTGAWQRFVNSRNFYLLAAFFLPLILMWIVFIIRGVYPFGEKSVLVLDLNGQYVYFFEAMRDIFQGQGSPFYTWYRSLGGEFSGIYAYYVASPFALLSVFFPENGITEFLLWMTLLKVGSSGLTFAIYLHNTRPSKPLNVVLFATCYAMTSYAVVQAHNTMWIDSLIYLPLICLGIENIVKYGKYRMYCLFLALCFISNFYIGWMTAIFSTLYFFYAYLSKYSFKNFERFFFAFYKWLAFSVVGAAIASIIILPTYYSLKFGKNTFQNPSYAFEARFDFINIFTQMLPNSYDTVRPNGLPFIYCGMICLLLIPVYFATRRKTGREKICAAIILAVMILSFVGSTIDLFWHGLQKPNWLNYRYSYMFCFLVIVFAYDAFRELDSKLFRTTMGVGGVIGVLLVIVQALPDSTFTVTRASNNEFVYVNNMLTIWFSICMLGILLALLWAVANKKRGASVLLLAVVCAELLSNGIYDTVQLHNDVVYSPRSNSSNSNSNAYVDFMARWSGIVRSVQEQDDTLYRMEKTVHRKVNDNMTLRMRGITNSTSTLNASVIKLLNKLGYASKSHWSRYVGGNIVNDSLLGIKYVLADDDDDLPPDYELMFTEMDPTKLGLEIEEDDDDYLLYAYRNNYALPVMYGVSENIQRCDITDVRSAPEVLNAVITAMVGHNAKVFAPVVVGDNDFEYTNVEKRSSGQHRKWSVSPSGSTGTLNVTFTVEKDGAFYMHFPSDYPRDTLMRTHVIHADGTKAPTKSFNYMTSETHTMYYLGDFEKGDEVTLDIVLKDSGGTLYYYKDCGYVYYFDREVYEKAHAELEASAANITEFTDTHIKATVNMAEGDTVMFTSIPYDAGWTVRVDGKRVKLKAVTEDEDGEFFAGNKVLGALLAFEVPEGEHTVELTYVPQGFMIGAALAAAGIALLIALTVTGERRRIKRRNAKLAAYRAGVKTAVQIPAEVIPDGGAETAEETVFEETVPEEEAPEDAPDAAEAPAEDTPEDGENEKNSTDNE